MKKLDTAKAIRHNEGKIRLDLVPASLEEAVGEVMTKGLAHYPSRNWEKGLNWMQVVASLKRHLNSFEQGIDFDSNTGELHIAHVACNAAFLIEYYRTFPEGDDRPHTLKTRRKIGLDIDDCLSDFTGAYSEKFGVPIPTAWKFDRQFARNLKQITQDKDFIMSLKPKVDPLDIPFEPFCYITSRCVPNEWTEEWLDLHGFPTSPVYTVGTEMSKVEVARESGIDLFVDDKYENYRELNEAGILTYLFDNPHNRRYDVGYRRITHLNQLPLEMTK